MRIGILVVASLLAVAAFASSVTIQPIPFFNGPGTRIVPGAGHVRFDLDADQQLDLTIFSEGIICTMDIPPSFCSGTILARPEREAELLLSNSVDIKLVNPGDEIGPAQTQDAQWRTN